MHDARQDEPDFDALIAEGIAETDEARGAGPAAHAPGGHSSADAASGDREPVDLADDDIVILEEQFADDTGITAVQVASEPADKHDAEPAERSDAASESARESGSRAVEPESEPLATSRPAAPQSVDASRPVEPEPLASSSPIGHEPLEVSRPVEPALPAHPASPAFEIDEATLAAATPASEPVVPPAPATPAPATEPAATEPVVHEERTPTLRLEAQAPVDEDAAWREVDSDSHITETRLPAVEPVSGETPFWAAVTPRADDAQEERTAALDDEPQGWSLSGSYGELHIDDTDAGADADAAAGEDADAAGSASADAAIGSADAAPGAAAGPSAGAPRTEPVASEPVASEPVAAERTAAPSASEPALSAPQSGATTTPTLGSDAPDAPGAPGAESPGVQTAAMQSQGTEASGAQTPNAQAPDAEARGTHAPSTSTAATSAPTTQAPSTLTPTTPPPTAQTQPAPTPATERDEAAPSAPNDRIGFAPVPDELGDASPTDVAAADWDEIAADEPEPHAHQHSRHEGGAAFSTLETGVVPDLERPTRGSAHASDAAQASIDAVADGLVVPGATGAAATGATGAAATGAAAAAASATHVQPGPAASRTNAPHAQATPSEPDDIDALLGLDGADAADAAASHANLADTPYGTTTAPSVRREAANRPGPVRNPGAAAVEAHQRMIHEQDEPDTDDPIAQAAIDRVRRWLAPKEGVQKKRDKSAERLAGLLKDPKGLDFAIGFVDRVVRPEDAHVSARNFERLSRDLPDFLDWYLKAGVAMGGGFGVIAPRAIIPIAKRALRQMVSHLVIDATPERLTKSLARLRADGTRLNINLLGEAVLGEREAAKRLAGTMELLSRDDVEYVSIKVSSLAPQLNMWAFDETVDHVVEQLLPLYRIAASASPQKFINLDMEEYRDLDLTTAVFTAILSRQEFMGLEAGIVLQAYLPDALGVLQRLTTWAQERQAAGGAGIKVRVVKGANLAMERTDAAVHGWPLATEPSKAASDANYKRVLHFALQPEHAAAVRVGVAGHNLFDLAYAIELAQRAGTLDRIDVEMLLGMAAEHVDEVRAEVANVLLYTPVVKPRDFDAAVAYLVRRLEENGSGENFMSGMFDIDTDVDVFRRERDRFLASLDLMRAEDAAGPPVPNRTQHRGGDLAVSIAAPQDGFFNEPDTDPSLAGNRRWARQIIDRAASSTLGNRTLELNHIDDIPTLDRRIGKAIEAQVGWAAMGAKARARILDDAAVTLGVYRGRLLETMMSETGKTIAEGDPEVSEAIDFARYYGEQAIALEDVEHAEFVPVPLTGVTPPWNFPVAIPCGGITAALAAGSAVIIKPAQLARRSAAVLCEALWEAGVPRDVLVLCDISDRTVSKRLITHPGVGRLILTGSSETAAMFTSWRPELPLLAETSGKNGIIVTPAADLDLAAADVARSAFGHAGQKCSAASLAILVGSVGTSARFRSQLVDAVETLRVGMPTDARVHMGPIIEPAAGKLRDALTELGEGESWLVEPKQLDDAGRVWSPGVRIGVQPGSTTHVTEFFGPHLSIMTAPTLEDAIAIQNATDFGLTAGIHSLDDEEVAEWLDAVEAGNLYVNRGITGAIVRRQPFGGWKLSQVGPGAKAGGPNYLATLGDWKPLFTPPKRDVKLVGLDRRVSDIIEAATPQLDFLEFDRVRAGANSDQRAWDAEFGVARDVSALGVERNVFRYRPTDVMIRVADDGTMGQLMRLLAAATRARSRVRVSSSKELPPHVVALSRANRPPVRIDEIVVESDAEFHARIASGDALAALEREGVLGETVRVEPVHRIRVAGTDAGLREALAGNVRVAVYDGPISTEGRVELLPFLREQAISITAHRFGNPDPAFVDLEVPPAR